MPTPSLDFQVALNLGETVPLSARRETSVYLDKLDCARVRSVEWIRRSTDLALRSVRFSGFCNKLREFKEEKTVSRLRSMDRILSV